MLTGALEGLKVFVENTTGLQNSGSSGGVSHHRDTGRSGV